MSSLNGHLSLFATQSLKSIDKWMNTVQGNLTGSVRNAYKESELTYGGNNVNILKETSMIQNGIQIGEQALSVGNTRLKWDTGEIIGSTQETHFAIQGTGFFLVIDPTRAGTAGSGGFDGSTGVSGTIPGVYLTKDGELHWGSRSDVAGSASDPILLTADGLVVQSDLSDGPNVGNSDNIYKPVFLSEFNNPALKSRPSVVQPSADTADRFQPLNIIDYKDLRFSNYGSTVFEVPTSRSIKTIVNGSKGNLSTRQIVSPNANGETAAGFSSDSQLIEKALEGSNVNVERNIVELAALGKVYNGFVQVIKVYNSTLDEVLGFIR